MAARNNNPERIREWKRNNPEKVKASGRRYYEANKEKLNKRAMDWAKENKDKVKANGAKYKREKWRTDPDFRQKTKDSALRNRKKRLELMAGRPRSEACELCGQIPKPTQNARTVVFDHCHATGKFRGWLCDRCNKVLGLVYDDQDLLLKMRDYLVRNQHGDVIDAGQKIFA